MFVYFFLVNFRMAKMSFGKEESDPTLVYDGVKCANNSVGFIEIYSKPKYVEIVCNLDKIKSIITKILHSTVR